MTMMTGGMLPQRCERACAAAGKNLQRTEAAQGGDLCRRRDDGERQWGQKPIADRTTLARGKRRGCEQSPCTATGLRRKMPASAMADTRLGSKYGSTLLPGTTRAREPKRVWMAGWLRPCSRDMPAGTTACCAGLRCSYPPEGQYRIKLLYPSS